MILNPRFNCSKLRPGEGVETEVLSVKVTGGLEGGNFLKDFPNLIVFKPGLDLNRPGNTDLRLL